MSHRPHQWYPSYVVVIEHRDDECIWQWAAWTEDKTVTLADGRTRTRRGAARQATRAIRNHARRRGDKPDWWWESTADNRPDPAAPDLVASTVDPTRSAS